MKFLFVLILPFFVGSTESNSSLTLMNLQVKATQTGQVITWKTISEHNCKGFEVQHSLNGEDWEELSYLPTIGSSESGGTYEVYYQTKIAGNHFYRLKQLSQTGAITFSETLKIKVKKRNHNN